MSQNHIILLVIVSVFILALITWQGKTLAKSILLFVIIMFPKRKIHLPNLLFPKIDVKEYVFENSSRLILPDIYRPKKNKKYPGLVVFAPLAREGKRDHLVVNFLKGLSRLGFAVMVPFWSNRTMGTISKTDANDLIASCEWFQKQKFISKEKIGLIAVSYGSGPALIALQDKKFQKHIKFFMSVSGYFDIFKTALFAITGLFKYKNFYGKVIPEKYAKYILFFNAAKWSKKISDKKIFLNLAKKLDQIDINKIRWSYYANKLSVNGRKILSWITSKTEKEFVEKFPKKIQSIQNYFLQLNTKKIFFKKPVLILHSTKDHLVPFTQSVEMYDNIKGEEKTIVLIDAFDHTMPLPATFKNLLTIYVPNFFRLVRFIYLMIYYQTKK